MMRTQYEGRSVTVHMSAGGSWTGTIAWEDEGGIELMGVWRFSQEREAVRHRIYIPWTSVSYVEIV